MRPDHAPPGGAHSSPEERLERGEIILHPVCPFALPEGVDRQFLFEQSLAGRAHKNISYNPATGKVAGFRRKSRAEADRLRQVLAAFGAGATAWLAEAFPRYAVGWLRDRVSFRPEEEATRRLRLRARNDLLHVDAFPSRPTHGARILRVFANVNLTEPRVWVTSDLFPELLERFGARVGLPAPLGYRWAGRLGQRLLGLFRTGGAGRSDYDVFMLRLHDVLKGDEKYQEQSRKRLWKFPPDSAWVVFSDGVSHAALRGRYALEHSYFVPQDCLVLPDESPTALLAQACAVAGGRRAA